VRVTTVVLSSQHDANVSQERIRGDLIEQVAKPVLATEEIDASRVVYHINPSGRFVTGGPQGDCGLTGRKIIVDTYGGWGRHGGGAFSGKDPSKVDRSASYAARHIAKNIVGADLADAVEVQLAYAIGVADPVSVHVDTFGTGKVPDTQLVKAVRDVFQLTPRGMTESLDLRRPVYRPTAAYGHFGRDEAGFTWEKLDRVEQLKRSV
jgi:S-adenosylmethionine synthetase